MYPVVDLGKGPPPFILGKKKDAEGRKAGRASPSPSLAPPVGMYVLYLYCIVFVFHASGGIVYYYTIVFSKT